MPVGIVGEGSDRGDCGDVRMVLWVCVKVEVKRPMSLAVVCFHG